MSASIHQQITPASGILYVPQQVLDNPYFASIVDTNDKWITQRTGIKERRRSEPNQFASDLGYQAALNMEVAYPGALSDVDAILVATCTPDTYFPSTAAIIQAKLDLTECAAFDISNACAGFITALQTALGMLAIGTRRKVLVIGSETSRSTGSIRAAQRKYSHD